MGVSETFAQNALALTNLATTQIGTRNRVINGACLIAQRPALAVTTGINGYGGPDRYNTQNLNAAGGEFTQSQGTITYNGVPYYAVMQTVDTAIVSTTTTNFWYGLNQPIEGCNCYDLLGKPVVVSFIFNTNVTGMYSVALRDGSSVNEYVTTFTAVANVPQRVVVPIPAIPLDADITNSTAVGLYLNVGAINTGNYQALVLNAWGTGNYFAAAGATNWGMTAGHFIALSQLQLEAGTVATQFENRPYAVELASCQRYYQIVHATMRTYAENPAQYCDITVPYQGMRATPTYTLLGYESNYNITSATLIPEGSNGSRFEIVSTNAGDTYAVSYEYGLNAEL
jgi:hypothetical protein